MTYRVLYVRHIEPVVPSPILTAREPGHSVLEPTIESGRGRHAFGCTAWRIQSPSCSLRTGRPAAVCSTVHSGRQRRLHRQATQEPHPASAPNGACSQSADQRLGCSSAGGTTSGCSAPWVEPGFNGNWLCNCNLGRIVCRHKSGPSVQPTGACGQPGCPSIGKSTSLSL